MRRTAVVLVGEGSEEIEAITPGDVLVRSGVDVIYAGVDRLEMKGSRGLPMRCDALVSELGDELFDAVVVPGGGPGAEAIAGSAGACELIRRHWDAGRIIGAICAAPAVVLAPLGLLGGRRAACYPGLEERFGADVTRSDERVVVDGNLVTSRGPGTAMEFALVLAELLTDGATARRVREEMLV